VPLSRGWLGRQAQETLTGGGNLAELLANAGIDASILDGLTQAEITGLLAQNGIDLSQVSETQIGDLFASFGGEQVQSLLGNFGFGEGGIVAKPSTESSDQITSPAST
jgi:hypothetical protein